MALLAAMHVLAESIICQAEHLGLPLLSSGHACSYPDDGGGSPASKQPSSPACCHADCQTAFLLFSQQPASAHSQDMSFRYRLENERVPAGLAREIHQPPRLS